MRKGIPIANTKGAHLPDAAAVMLATRQLNTWLGTGYTVDEVEEMLTSEPLFYDIFSALAVSLVEPKTKVG